MSRRRLALVAALVVVVALVVVAVVVRRDEAPASVPAPAQADPTPGRPTPSPTRTARPRLVGDRTGDVLVLPSLGVRAPLVSVAMSATRTLTPPRNPREVGYWDGSAAPGSATGQTLVAGHTVHTGGGALDRLATLQPGDRVVIRRPSAGAERIAYRVVTVEDLSKAQLAARATDLFGQGRGAGQLRLVTCTGWNGRSYAGNTVVTAVPLRPPA
ncbi:hypothetical protein GCM10011519_26690 [Marmoricola endophyticus]|uniref:Class F sortase n=1 Tax=Marmoricola endophyticus TaxID=2040280 RepID=A0A917BNY1_9ACTN|nr:class F sortase [Marmoricola endophyticus]GGF51334.1 hypothetical protein GCM10011519_26690 [Marmoricola endophyticus]